MSAAIMPRTLGSLPLGVNYQYPNSSLHAAFGELNITPQEDRLDVVLTLLMEPIKEGSQTGVALDGSDSMQPVYGHAYDYSELWNPDVVEELIAAGQGAVIDRDGERFFEATAEGREELIRRGFIRQSRNEVDPVARDVIPYLAEKIDADGGTTAIYWACGEAGDGVEILGDLTSEEARATAYAGPREWGLHTQLLPAMKYFVERFADAAWGFYVFVTDGCLDDLEEVKSSTAELARRIAAGEAKPLKCVLIGVGASVDEQQMIELDDLPEEMSLPVDIWDHKIAASMRGLRDIFAEVVEENTVVAPSGRVLDDNSALAASFADGVPALLKFSLPKAARSFTLEVGGTRLEQRLE